MVGVGGMVGMTVLKRDLSSFWLLMISWSLWLGFGGPSAAMNGLYLTYFFYS